ncbi:hypothetical protein [Pyrobaculum sp.]|uniref:hypothetical protein n=1 Tax=Pyrobaculum sp. TaxID=2004705 RepID=UPI00316B3DC4
MIPKIRKTGLRNLLFHFPPLAYYVLVSFEGGNPAEEAKLVGDAEEVGRYVSLAVRSLEREVLHEVLQDLASDAEFAAAVYNDLSRDVLQKSAEHWEAAAIFAKYLFGELEPHTSFVRCMELNEFKSLCELVGVKLEMLREMKLVFVTWDSVTEKYMACSPVWLRKAVETISSLASFNEGEEALKIVEDFVAKLFNNPRGYAAVRSDVFKDVPVIPLDVLIGQVVELPGVFNGKRVNPLLRERIKRLIFSIEGKRVAQGELDPEFGVYVDGDVVYAPVPEAVGHKVVRKYHGKKIDALARWRVEAERYKPYLAPYGISILPPGG